MDATTLKKEEKEEAARRIYEIAYLFDSGAEKENAKRPRSYIEEEKAIIIEEGEPALIKLSYPVNKKEEAYFGWFKFLARPDGLKNIQNKFENDSGVLRKLLIKSKQKELVDNIQIKKKKLEPKEKIQIEEIDKKLEELLQKI